MLWYVILLLFILYVMCLYVYPGGLELIQGSGINAGVPGINSRPPPPPNINKQNIKSIKLPVSAPFHCKLMKNATTIMQNEIQKYDFKNPKNTQTQFQKLVKIGFPRNS